jgi:hypothetical protein
VFFLTLFDSQEETMERTLWRIMAVLCVAAVWAVGPAWGDGGGQEATAPATAVEQPAETAAEQPEAPVEAAAGVRVDSAAISQDIVDRMPVATGEVFARQVSRLYCWSRVVGATGETFVTHNWYYQGAFKASVQLPVRSNNWRTWSAKTLDPDSTGEWMVEILSADGEPLESIIFFVQ